MAESTIVKNMRDGTLTFAVGANSYEFRFEQGTFKLQVPGPSVSVYLDRGQFGSPPSLRYNEDQPMSGSFSVYFRDVSDASYATALEFITKTGAYGSGWGSSLGSSAEVKTGTLTWDVAGTVHGDTTSHQIQLPYCVLRGGAEEGNPNVINFEFQSFAVYPTVT